MTDALALSPTPELVFGLIAPIGVDLDLVSNELESALKQLKYNAHSIRLTTLMRDVPVDLNVADQPYIKSYTDRIAYANEVRRLLGDEALAILAVSAIRSFRAQVRTGTSPSQRSLSHSENGEREEELPLPSQAYIVRQLKRPEEVSLLRGVYGRQFILVAAYAPETMRVRRLIEQERTSTRGLVQESELEIEAKSLVSQDSKEVQDIHGQNVRDAFPLADVFIDASSRPRCEATVRRFIRLLFGSNEITPTRTEYGMYLAKSASLRSSDLSRQVGAAVFRSSGEVLTLGCNEVPKAGGGTYWADDPTDGRDFVLGYDPNERSKGEVLVDLLHRLKSSCHLSIELQEMESATDVADFLLQHDNSNPVAESKVMDLLEFGRIIHAEMSAICDASRKGISLEDSTLFCTAFPCHICAKHIVAAGITSVVYLEPYPKSYAAYLHSDSITLDSEDGKVNFKPFLGVSPFRYRDLFEKGRRKYIGGLAQKWNKDQVRPMIEVYYPSYFKAEAVVVSSLVGKLEQLERGSYS